MIDIRLLRSEPDTVRKGMARRGAGIDIDAILAVDGKRRELVHQMEQLRAEQNAASKEIGARKKAKEDASEAIAAMQRIKEQIGELEDAVRRVDEELRGHMMAMPNIPAEDLPDGKDDTANRVERTWGEPRPMDFAPRDHVDLGEGLGLLDLERAAKLAGSRFALSMGALARLERALINFMLDVHTSEHGYTETLPPFMVNSAALQGTGQLPKFAEDLFRLEGTDYWLIPTAEVPVTNIHQEEILPADALPLYYTAYTPCFRSEAGSYGKDTRGLIRLHQFNKVELVKFVLPEDSWDELERLTNNAETILQRLNLPYRVVTLSTGDVGFSAAKTYDLEVWLPGQQAYREISSCSNFLDFQARRANIRFKRDKKPEFVHTLNGSGLAVGRTLVAILENCQEADGGIALPEALWPYMGGLQRIAPGA